MAQSEPAKVLDVEKLFSVKEIERLPENIHAEVISNGSLPISRSLSQPRDNQKKCLMFRRTTKHDADDTNISEVTMEETTLDLLGSINGHSPLQYLTVQDARAILSVITMSHRSKELEKDSELNLPAWVMCDAQDVNRTYMMGCHHIDGGLVISSITCDGPFEKGALPPMDKLRKSISSTGDENISSRGYAEYILGTAVSLKSKTDDDGNPISAVTMGWSWEKVTDLLVSPHGLQCSLKIKKGKGGFLSTTPERNSRELHVLRSFINGLSTGEVYWPPLEHTPGSITDIVSTYLQDLRDNPVKYVNEDQIAMFEDPEHYGEDVLGKRVLDFTERIWLIVAHTATSYEDITATFDLVESAFRKGYLQPMIHQDNQSSMANKIREFYQSSDHIGQWESFSLQHTSALELVIGIALDKIRRDFTTYLVDNNLCLGHQLSWYIPPRDTDMNLEVQAKRLQCLHHVVELGLLVNGELKGYISYSLDLVKSALLHYTSHPPDDEYEVDAPAIPEMLKPLCQEDRTIPSFWRVELRAAGRREQSLTVTLSRSAPFPQIERRLKFDSTMEIAQEDENLSYYMTMMRQHQIRLL